MTMSLEFNQKERRVPFQLNVPESLDRQFREYVNNKHHGYRKGLFATELELALKNLMESEVKD